MSEPNRKINQVIRILPLLTMIHHRCSATTASSCSFIFLVGADVQVVNGAPAEPFLGPLLDFTGRAAFPSPQVEDHRGMMPSRRSDRDVRRRIRSFMALASASFSIFPLALVDGRFRFSDRFIDLPPYATKAPARLPACPRELVRSSTAISFIFTRHPCLEDYVAIYVKAKLSSPPCVRQDHHLVDSPGVIFNGVI